MSPDQLPKTKSTTVEETDEDMLKEKDALNDFAISAAAAPAAMPLGESPTRLVERPDSDRAPSPVWRSSASAPFARFVSPEERPPGVMTARELVKRLIGSQHPSYYQVVIALLEMPDDDVVIFLTKNENWIGAAVENTLAVYTAVIDAFATYDANAGLLPAEIGRRDFPNLPLFRFVGMGEALAVNKRIGAQWPEAFSVPPIPAIGFPGREAMAHAVLASKILEDSNPKGSFNTCHFDVYLKL